MASVGKTFVHWYPARKTFTALTHIVCVPNYPLLFYLCDSLGLKKIVDIRLEGPVLGTRLIMRKILSECCEMKKRSPLWCIYLVRWWAHNDVLIKNHYPVKLLERGGRRRRQSIQNLPQAGGNDWLCPDLLAIKSVDTIL